MTTPGYNVAEPQQVALSTRQKQAMRAAYAVGAARRAAKLAWLKVMRKVDHGTMKRNRLSLAEGSRSVAANTAIKALVHTLEAPRGIQNHGAVLSATSSTQGSTVSRAPGQKSLDERLKLPKSPKKKAQSAKQPTAAAKPSAPQATQAKGVTSEAADLPTGFTEVLPKKMTNKQAKKRAEVIQRVVQKATRKQKALARRSATKAARKLRRQRYKLMKIAKKRLLREKFVQEENVRAAQKALVRVKKRAKAADRRATKEERIELREATKQEKTALKVALAQKIMAQRDASKRLKRVKKDMRTILHGHQSPSAEWDATLYKPKVVVLPDSKYQKYKAMKKAKKESKKLKEKQAMLLALNARKKRRQAKMQARMKLKQLRKQKISMIDAARTEVKQAKTKLETAIKAPPTNDQGLLRYNGE